MKPLSLILFILLYHCFLEKYAYYFEFDGEKYEFELEKNEFAAEFEKLLPMNNISFQRGTVYFFSSDKAFCESMPSQFSDFEKGSIYITNQKYLAIGLGNDMISGVMIKIAQFLEDDKNKICSILEDNDDLIIMNILKEEIKEEIVEDVKEQGKPLNAVPIYTIFALLLLFIIYYIIALL